MAKRVRAAGLQGQTRWSNSIRCARLAGGDRCIENQNGISRTRNWDSIWWVTACHDLTIGIQALPAPIDEAISKYDLVAASVPGNRQFRGPGSPEHQRIFSCLRRGGSGRPAGRVDIDLSREPPRPGTGGEEVFQKTSAHVAGGREPNAAASNPEVFRSCTAIRRRKIPKWKGNLRTIVQCATCYAGEKKATYIRNASSSLSSRLKAEATIRGNRRRAISGNLEIARHEEPHFARRPHQKSFPRPQLSHRNTVSRSEDFNATRSRRGNRRCHDSRHLRQCAESRTRRQHRRRCDPNFQPTGEVSDENL